MLLRTMTNFLDVSETHTPLEERISFVADSNNSGELCRLLAARIGFDEQTTERFLLGEDEKAPALMARAAGLSSNAYSAVLRFRHRLLRTAIAPAPMLTAYPRLPRMTQSELKALLLMGLEDAA